MFAKNQDQDYAALIDIQLMNFKIHIVTRILLIVEMIQYLKLIRHLKLLQLRGFTLI